MLHWQDKSHDIFKRWYIDGRIYFHKMVKDDAQNEGIVELRYVDPRNIRKVREIEKGVTPEQNELVKGIKEYFLF